MNNVVPGLAGGGLPMIAAAISAMRAKGISANDILDVVEAMASTLISAPVSTPVHPTDADTSTERRRAWDRKRKREKREKQRNAEMSGGIPVESGGMSALSGGIPVESGGMSALSGGIPVESGGMSALSGGIPVDTIPTSSKEMSPTPPITQPSPTQEKTPKGVQKKGAGSEEFETFWQAYPKRSGNNSRKDAADKFALKVRQGRDPAAILDGARRYAAWCEATGKIGTEYVKTASVWLNQEQWENDFIVPGETAIPLVSGSEASESGFRKMVRDWQRAPGFWPPAILPPDHPDCPVPPHILAEFGITARRMGRAA